MLHLPSLRRRVTHLTISGSDTPPRLLQSLKGLAYQFSPRLFSQVRFCSITSVCEHQICSSRIESGPNKHQKECVDSVAAQSMQLSRAHDDILAKICRATNQLGFTPIWLMDTWRALHLAVRAGICRFLTQDEPESLLSMLETCTNCTMVAAQQPASQLALLSSVLPCL